jgi:hypothetical protein
MGQHALCIGQSPAQSKAVRCFDLHISQTRVTCPSDDDRFHHVTIALCQLRGVWLHDLWYFSAGLRSGALFHARRKLARFPIPSLNNRNFFWWSVIRAGRDRRIFSADALPDDESPGLHNPQYDTIVSALAITRIDPVAGVYCTMLRRTVGACVVQFSNPIAHDDHSGC